MSTCNNCGATLGLGQSKCVYCGTAAPVMMQQPQAGMPPASAPMHAATPPGAIQPKSKIAAGVLGILLGCFGVHNFYLGFTGKAVAQLLITLLTCGYGGLISGIWGLIEGILILTGSISKDARGVPLAD